MLIGPFGGLASAVARLLARAGGAAARLLERLIPRPPFPAAPPPTPIPPAIEEAVGRLTPQERAEIGELARREITAEDFAARLRELGRDVVLTPEGLPLSAKRFTARGLATFKIRYRTDLGEEVEETVSVGFNTPSLLSELEAKAKSVLIDSPRFARVSDFISSELIYVARSARFG